MTFQLVTTLQHVGVQDHLDESLRGNGMAVESWIHSVCKALQPDHPRDHVFPALDAEENVAQNLI